MQKYFRLILLVLTGFSINTSQAQTTILDQTLLTQASFNTFTVFNTIGTQTWNFSSSYGAMCSGYSAGQNYENEDWLVGPVMNLSQMDNVKLTFSHTRGSAAVMNAGVTEGWYKVFATSSFTGDPATTQWVELTGFNQSVPAAWQYVSSGELTLPESVKSANSRVAFRYVSSAAQSATWEIKNVKVIGDPQTTNPNLVTFKITNWNTEWLGCTQFGPTDETLQINNVASAMLAMNSDIFCIQEVSNSVASPSIETLVSLMGSEWDGKILPATTDDCEQRQGIIYKKARVQFLNSSQLSSGNSAQGNSYYYNWTSGRYPSLYNVNLVAGSNLYPVSIINIHAKSEDGDAMSYTRRLGGSEALKALLDGGAFNTKKVMLIGDFNDFLVGTSSTACACSVSPYKNFMDDQANYSGISQYLNDSHWNRPLIENFIISNELFANYTSNSVVQNVSVPQSISNYYNTTSDHLPVTASFQFSTLNNPEFNLNKTMNIYPNPVKDELRFEMTGLQDDAVAVIYDVTGRKIFNQKINTNVINVVSLPKGVYILKVGERFGRFIKE